MCPMNTRKSSYLFLVSSVRNSTLQATRVQHVVPQLRLPPYVNLVDLYLIHSSNIIDSTHLSRIIFDI